MITASLISPRLELQPKLLTGSFSLPCILQELLQVLEKGLILRPLRKAVPLALAPASGGGILVNKGGHFAEPGHDPGSWGTQERPTLLLPNRSNAQQ